MAASRWGWRPRVGAESAPAAFSSSRTVSAMIGIASARCREAVTTLAVAEKSGRVSGGGFTRRTVTS